MTSLIAAALRDQDLRIERGELAPEPSGRPKRIVAPVVRPLACCDGCGRPLSRCPSCKLVLPHRARGRGCGPVVPHAQCAQRSAA